MADNDDWDWALAVIEPALILGDRGFLLDIRTRLAAEGVVAAVLDRDSATIYDWLLHAMQHQGISDAIAETFIENNAPVGWAEIADTLPVHDGPACQKLKSYWHFDGCGYQKSTRTCSEPALLSSCPLPTQPLRNGRLSQNAYSLFLFIRDVCDGDIVGWNRPPSMGTIIIEMRRCGRRSWSRCATSLAFRTRCCPWRYQQC